MTLFDGRMWQTTNQLQQDMAIASPKSLMGPNFQPLRARFVSGGPVLFGGCQTFWLDVSSTFTAIFHPGIHHSPKYRDEVIQQHDAELPVSVVPSQVALQVLRMC